MRFLFTVLFMCTLTVSVYPSDFSSWKKFDVVRVSWKFIEDTKKELLQRADAVEKLSGEKVALTFTYNSNMDRKAKVEHDKFLKVRMTEKQVHAYLAPYLAELEKNRAVLASAEEKAEKIWEGKNEKGEMEEDVTSEAELYGEKISSKRLGIILDNSYSMTTVLPKLREEIKDKFKNSFFVEIYGSILQFNNQKLVDKTWFYISPESGENPFMKKWYCQSLPLQNAHYFISGFQQSNIQAFAALAAERKVDTIYWFTDLRDKGSDDGHKVLSQILKKYKIKLYLHTTGNQPKTALRKIVKESGGDVIRKRIK